MAEWWSDEGLCLIQTTDGNKRNAKIRAYRAPVSDNECASSKINSSYTIRTTWEKGTFSLSLIEIAFLKAFRCNSETTNCAMNCCEINFQLPASFARYYAIFSSKKLCGMLNLKKKNWNRTPRKRPDRMNLCIVLCVHNGGRRSRAPIDMLILHRRQQCNALQ